ncbi:MAG: hypothetical protein KC668_26100 [Myxococcales bacterium]|nr:hypothetical protein [Myxococcales bacterium]
MAVGLRLAFTLSLSLAALAPAANTRAQDPAGTRQRRVVVSYEEGMTIPPGRSYLRVTPRRTQLVAGALFLGGGYLVGAVARTIMSARRDDFDARAFVPFAGAVWFAYHNDRRKAAGILSLLGQSLGLGLLIAGVLRPERELVYYTARGRGLTADVMPLPGGAQLSLRVF